MRDSLLRARNRLYSHPSISRLLRLDQLDQKDLLDHRGSLDHKARLVFRALPDPKDLPEQTAARVRVDQEALRALLGFPGLRGRAPRGSPVLLDLPGPLARLVRLGPHSRREF
jgi:hypothetical protein